ncbi:MAG: ABC transporter ATP-binding protein [Candidatus Bathyarchaeota archaeon]
MIKVENISFAYPMDVKALEDVSVEINEGEFVAVMGENGAGKTTLAKHLNGLLKPDFGRVLIDGVDTRISSVASLSRIVGLVFQNPNHQLFCGDVEDELTFALRNYGFDAELSKERVERVLKLLRIEKYRSSPPLMLSEGEKKRVALACVLAWQPKFLVIDEPTIGQDADFKRQLRSLFMQLTNQGKTVITVTHDVEFIAECSPRVIILSHGRVAADGPAKQILTNEDLIEKTSLTLPQTAELFHSLSDLNFPKETIDIYEAFTYIKKRYGRYKKL